MTRKASCIESTCLWLAVVLVFICTFFISNVSEHSLPQPRDLDTPVTEFSEDRALSVLKNLISFALPKEDNLITPEGNVRPVGRITGLPPMEDVSMSYLLSTIRTYQSSSPLSDLMDIDSFHLNGMFPAPRNRGSIIYGNLTQLAVRIRTETPAPQNASLCLSAHVDSVTGSPGASDNGANVAVLMEVLRALSARTTPPEHPLIFLFNNGEEWGLHGVNGFMNSHPWAREISSCINLDSAGGWGRIFLSRVSTQPGETGDLLSSLEDGYPYPFGTVIGSDIFNSGLLPSMTDFTIFDSFRVKTADLDYIRNDYSYHTYLDTLREDYTPGTLQQNGDLMLHMIRKFNALGVSAFTLKDRTQDADVVPTAGSTVLPFAYYDILGHSWVAYSAPTFYALFSIFILLIAAFLLTKCYRLLKDRYRDYVPAIHRQSFATYFRKVVGVHFVLSIFSFACGILEFILSVMVAALLAVVVSLINAFGWFSNPWLGFFAFSMTSLLTLTVLHFTLFGMGFSKIVEKFQKMGYLNFPDPTESNLPINHLRSAHADHDHFSQLPINNGKPLPDSPLLFLYSQFGISSIHILLFILLSAYGKGSAYVFFWWTLFFVLSFVFELFMTRAFKIQKYTNLLNFEDDEKSIGQMISEARPIILYFGTFLIWSVFPLYVCIPVFSQFITFITPILGRSEIPINSVTGDLVFGVLISVMGNLIFCPIVSLLFKTSIHAKTKEILASVEESTSGSRSRKVEKRGFELFEPQTKAVVVFLCIFVVSLFVAICCTFPYTPNTPKRIEISTLADYGTISCDAPSQFCPQPSTPISVSLSIPLSSGPGALSSLESALNPTCNPMPNSDFSGLSCNPTHPLPQPNIALPTLQLISKSQPMPGHWAISFLIQTDAQDSNYWELTPTVSPPAASLSITDSGKHANLENRPLVYLGKPGVPTVLDFIIAGTTTPPSLTMRIDASYMVFTPEVHALIEALPDWAALEGIVLPVVARQTVTVSF